MWPKCGDRGRQGGKTILCRARVILGYWRLCDNNEDTVCSPLGHSVAPGPEARLVVARGTGRGGTADPLTHRCCSEWSSRWWWCAAGRRTAGTRTRRPESSPSRWPAHSCGSACGSSRAWAGRALPPPATPAR